MYDFMWRFAPHLTRNLWNKRQLYVPNEEIEELFKRYRVTFSLIRKGGYIIRLYQYVTYNINAIAIKVPY